MDNDKIVRVMRAYSMTPNEARLTMFLAAEQRVFTVFEIANHLNKVEQANENWFAVNNYVKVLIHKLRRKIGKQLLVNVWGIGYELTPNAELLEVLQ
jgi:DNA-binding response OmpR family regulator